MPHFNCVHCGHTVEFGESFTRTTISCPGCRLRVIVPRFRDATLSHVPSRTDAPRRRFSPEAFLTSRAFEATIFASVMAVATHHLTHKTEESHLPLGDTGLDVMLLEAGGATLRCAAAALLLALIFARIRAAFGRSFKTSLSWGYSVGIVVMMSVEFVGGILTWREDMAAAKAPISAENKIIAHEGAGLNRITAPQPSWGQVSDLTFDTHSPGNSDDERVYNLIASAFNDAVHLRNDYELVMKEAGAETLLLPGRLAHETDFRVSHEVLSKVKKIVPEFKKRFEDLFRELPKRARETPSSGSSLQNMEEKYQQALEQTLPSIRESWAIEVQSVELAEQIITFLEIRRGSWTVIDKQIKFEWAADERHFYEIISEYNAGAERVKQLYEKSLDEAKQRLQKMKDRLSDEFHTAPR